MKIKKENVIIKRKLLKYFEGNPREISEEDFDSLKRSIDKFGLVDPLIIDEQNVVIGGNQRLLAAEELGIEAIPCVRIKGLSRNEKRTLNIALNKISGEWDEEKLTDTIRKVKEEEEELMQYMGFDSMELRDILENEPILTSEDLDRTKNIARIIFEIPEGDALRLAELLLTFDLDRNRAIVLLVEDYMKKNEQK